MDVCIMILRIKYVDLINNNRMKRLRDTVVVTTRIQKSLGYGIYSIGGMILLRQRIGVSYFLQDFYVLFLSHVFWGPRKIIFLVYKFLKHVIYIELSFKNNFSHFDISIYIIYIYYIYKICIYKFINENKKVSVTMKTDKIFSNVLLYIANFFQLVKAKMHNFAKAKLTLTSFRNLFSRSQHIEKYIFCLKPKAKCFDANLVVRV